MTVTITLTRGMVALIDDDDIERISAHKWYCLENSGIHYAARNNNGGLILMHTEVLFISGGLKVKHLDNNTLNNQRANLVVASDELLQAGSKKKAIFTSRYKGVSWVKSRGNWRADIGSQTNHVFLGYFDNEADAARAYDIAAIERWGQYARPNFQNETEYTAALLAEAAQA